MRERYPFFRDEDERSRAVIGESAIEPDLNGHFEKPYAILTPKRLYCKNEQGNFIVETDRIKSVGEKAGLPMPVLGWVVLGLVFLLSALWVMFLASGAFGPGWTSRTGDALPLFLCVLVVLLMSFIWIRKRPQVMLACLMVGSIISSVNIEKAYNEFADHTRAAEMTARRISMLGVFALILGAVALFLYIKKEKGFAYEVRHSTGIFFFQRKDYPQEELEAFSKAIAELKGTDV